MDAFSIQNIAMFPSWTAEEEQYIRDNWERLSDTDMADHLGRTEKSVHNRRCALGLHRRQRPTSWSENEVDFLELHWGSWPSIKIARHLNRSNVAVVQKARTLGLYDQMNQGDMLSLAADTQMLGLKNTRIIRNWIENEGLRARRMHLSMGKGKEDQKHYVIKTQDFLTWLQAHPDRWDSRKIPLYGLGIEYPWLQEKRIADGHPAKQPVKRFWTDTEKSYLAMQIGRGIPYSAVAKTLGRSIKSVKSMGHSMGLVSGYMKRATA